MTRTTKAGWWWIARASLSAPPVVASMFLAPRIGILAERYPRLSISLRSELNLVSLDRGKANIAVRVSAAEQPDHAATRLGTIRLGLYAAPAMSALPPERWRFVGYGPELAMFRIITGSSATSLAVPCRCLPAT